VPDDSLFPMRPSLQYYLLPVQLLKDFHRERQFVSCVCVS
jgi:hypothetical protein